MDLISVIVPVYNVEQYLIRCIESIRNQTYANLEIVLVDDESPDRCPQICNEYLQKDNRIKVIHKKNAGLGMARNSGLEIISGSYVTFVDSDDWISPDHIMTLYKAASFAQADVAWGAHAVVSKTGEMIVRPINLEYRVFEGEEKQKKILLPLIGADQCFTQDVQINSSCCMNLYKTELIKRAKISFFSERYTVGEDGLFNVDICYHANRIVATNETGYYYFENSNSISRKYDSQRFTRTINYYKVSTEKVKQYNLQKEVDNRVERSFLMKLRVAIRHVVMSTLTKKQKISELKEILNHELVQKALSRYSGKNQAKAMQLLLELMRRKSVLGVYYLMLMREKARSQKTLKRIMAAIGIGR